MHDEMMIHDPAKKHPAKCCSSKCLGLPLAVLTLIKMCEVKRHYIEKSGIIVIRALVIQTTDLIGNFFRDVIIVAVKTKSEAKK